MVVKLKTIDCKGKKFHKMINGFFDEFDTNNNDRLNAIKLEQLLRKMYKKRVKESWIFWEMAQ